MTTSAIEDGTATIHILTDESPEVQCGLFIVRKTGNSVSVVDVTEPHRVEHVGTDHRLVGKITVTHLPPLGSLSHIVISDESANHRTWELVSEKPNKDLEEAPRRVDMARSALASSRPSDKIVYALIGRVLHELDYLLGIYSSHEEACKAWADFTEDADSKCIDYAFSNSRVLGATATEEDEEIEIWRRA